MGGRVSLGRDGVSCPSIVVDGLGGIARVEVQVAGVCVDVRLDCTGTEAAERRSSSIVSVGTISVCVALAVVGLWAC